MLEPITGPRSTTSAAGRANNRSRNRARVLLAYVVSADTAATIRGSTMTLEDASSDRGICRPKRDTRPESPLVF